MIQAKTYVSEDGHGGWRVGKLDVSLDSIVFAYRQGFSSEVIQQLYPVLTLEEVYGAITFYLANQAAVEQYLASQENRWEELRQRSQQSPSPVVARLREMAAISRAAS